MMKLLTYNSTFGRESVALAGNIIADNPQLQVTGLFLLER